MAALADRARGWLWGAFAAAVFLAGLVLPVWWLVAPHPGGVPGLGAYPSAYIGDTVLLPAGCLILMTGIRKLPPVRGERVVAAAGAAVAAVTAVLVQADWLQDPTTQPNWTQPRTGHFNAAGWWHAAYFTAMSILLVVLIVVFLLRARAGRLAGNKVVGEMSSGTGAALLLAALGSYAALAVHDDFDGPLSRSAESSIALACLALALAALLTGVAYARLAAVLVRPALVALGGIGVVLGFVTAPLVTLAVIGASAVAVRCGAAVERHAVRAGGYLGGAGRWRGRTWAALCLQERGRRLWAWMTGRRCGSATGPHTGTGRRASCPGRSSAGIRRSAW